MVTQRRECLFGDIVHGDMQLNDYGNIMQAVSNALPVHYPYVELDAFVVMPNYVHGIIVMIFDISNPAAPTFVQYVNNRDFSSAAVGPDSGPEIVKFVPANQSPTGKPPLLVANEVSGTVSIYEAN